MAAYMRHEAVVKLLLEKGAELETRRTMVQRRCHIGEEAVAKLLLENGAEIKIKDKNGRTFNA